MLILLIALLYFCSQTHSEAVRLDDYDELANHKGQESDMFQWLTHQALHGLTGAQVGLCDYLLIYANQWSCFHVISSLCLSCCKYSCTLIYTFSQRADEHNYARILILKLCKVFDSGSRLPHSWLLFVLWCEKKSCFKFALTIH